MAQDQHSLFREDLPAYALGALDAEDVAALETHLQTCESCRTELAEYRTISGNLLTALPPRRPSPALRKRLQSKLPSAHKTLRPRFIWSFGQLTLGGALVLLLIMNLISFMQMRAIQDQQAGLLNQLKTNQFALSMLAYPATQSLPIVADNFSGSVLVDKGHNTIALVTWHLPDLPQNQTYQIWLIEPGGQRVSAGLFRPQENSSYTTQPVFSKQALSNFVGIGVTVEPAGGSEQPTGPRVFRVDF
jgi:anti-sigma-K factor RskA